MNSIIKFYAPFFVGILCLVALPLQAQQNNSLYFMTGLPQSSLLNPATQPKCGFYLALPSIEMNLGNSTVNFNDIFVTQPGQDSRVSYMENTTTRNNFINKIKSNLNLFGETRLDLISLGFRIKNTYLSLGVGGRIESNSFLPPDVVRFAVQNKEDLIGGTLQSFNFSGLSLNTTFYSEYSLGISHELSKSLTIGIRGKLLFGVANFTASTSDVSFNNGGLGSYQLHSVFNINSSLPNLTVYSEPNGKVDSVDFRSIENSEVRSILTNTKNMGLAVDLGVIYKPIEKLSLSLSVLDLGYIKWKDNLHNFQQDASFDSKQINIMFNNSTDIVQALTDTVQNKFSSYSNATSYKTNLSGKLYAGALFQATKGIGFGALTRQQIIDSKLKSQFTLSLNLYPANAINFTLSYTIADKMYDNFGMGFSFKLAFLQAYVMSERIPFNWSTIKYDGGQFPIPPYYKSFNIRTGINLVLGYRHRDRKLNKDKPLIDL